MDKPPLAEQKEIKENEIKRISSPTYYDQITNQYPQIDLNTYKYLLDIIIRVVKTQSRGLFVESYCPILFFQLYLLK